MITGSVRNALLDSICCLVIMSPLRRCSSKPGLVTSRASSGNPEKPSLHSPGRADPQIPDLDVHAISGRHFSDVQCPGSVHGGWGLVTGGHELTRYAAAN